MLFCRKVFAKRWDTNSTCLPTLQSTKHSTSNYYACKQSCYECTDKTTDRRTSCTYVGFIQAHLNRELIIYT